MSISFPIVNIEGINWGNHNEFHTMLSEGKIIKGDLAVIENKLECPLPLKNDEYCIIIDNDEVFIEEQFSDKECRILFGDKFRLKSC